jgi:hypothetical protein
MVDFPEPDRVDLGTLALIVGLLFVAYVIYPAHLLQVSVWYSIVLLFTCWTGYFVYRMVYDEPPSWE